MDTMPPEIEHRLLEHFGKLTGEKDNDNGRTNRKTDL
jgi:hypothetical protein